MHYILDDIQNELREPHHDYPGSRNSMSLIQHEHFIHNAKISELKLISAKYFSDPDVVEKLRCEYIHLLGSYHAKHYGDVTFLVMGKEVISYGIGFTSTEDMAIEKHVNPADCSFIVARSPDIMFIRDDYLDF